MSLLALSAQIFATTRLGVYVPRALFTPPPKVDSRVVVLEFRAKPLIDPNDEKAFWRVAHAGFAGKRKKLRGSIAAGLHVSKPDAETLLRHANINPDCRAEELSIAEWLRLAHDAV